MSHQLSLFPSHELPETKDFMSDGELCALDEMFAASQSLRDPLQYRDLLQFIARFPQYSPFNALLLYLQNPRLTFIATAGNWLKRFGRHPKKSARPLIILAPMSPIRFVYDIEDTEGKAFPAALMKPETATDAQVTDMFEKTVHNCAIQGISVRELAVVQQSTQSAIQLTDDIRRRYPSLDLDAKMSYLILLDADHAVADKYAALVYEIGRIFCGHQGRDQNAWWHDRQRSSATVKAIETHSAAYLVCQRSGLFKHAAKHLNQMSSADSFIPPIGFNAVLQSAHHIEKMGKSLWKKLQKRP